MFQTSIKINLRNINESHLRGRGQDGPHTRRGRLLSVSRILQEIINVGKILPRTGDLSALSWRFWHLLVLFRVGRARCGQFGDARFLILPVILPVNLKLVLIIPF